MPFTAGLLATTLVGCIMAAVLIIAVDRIRDLLSLRTRIALQQQTAALTAEVMANRAELAALQEDLGPLRGELDALIVRVDNLEPEAPGPV
ncbi:hypothetical protein B9Z19DRAFT_1089978 [Tuber borchii]|uniref:Uncharacterized protein n=1 Tax=Tuber borchii TaxID=42251 RepID=A0A2T6ZJD9_TUBBO|nr:hypothetical protein B9Z19DRAFT_1089978 [Tuber borchii]